MSSWSAEIDKVATCAGLLHPNKLVISRKDVLALLQRVEAEALDRAARLVETADDGAPLQCMADEIRSLTNERR